MPSNSMAVTKPRPTTNAVTSGSGDCSCSNFINRNGFGRCRKSDSDFGGRKSCYVSLPTTCTDLVKSNSNQGKFLSANACKSGFTSKPTKPTTYARPVTKPVNNRPAYTRPVTKPVNNRPVSKPRPTPITSSSGCSCSNFVNRNGFGRCLKKDSDFGHKVSCYVNLPSSCGDLIRSGSNWGKYLSAEACQTRPFSHFKKKEFNN